MLNIYANTDILLMTSAFEGLPIVVMQTMAHGRIVVSTAVNGIPDYVKHNENGLLIYAQSEADIINEGVTHIELLLNDPALRLRLGQRSREIALQKFSREVFCKTYRGLLKL
jgi:glycosyltransferase involved in cell wall biosynthesis